MKIARGILGLGPWLWDASTERANPILARTVRQELRNRTFFAIYLLLVGVAGVASIILAVLARDESHEYGPILFSILGGALTFAIFVPGTLNAYRAIVRERDEDTWDLILLTGMRPGRLLRGMVLANTFQSLYYLAAIAPFMLMAYLLRGIDLVTIVLLLGYVVTAGLVLSCFAVFWGCLGPTKASRASLGVLLVLGCLTLWGLNIGLWANLNEVMRDLSRILDEPAVAVTLLGLALNGVIDAVVLLLSLAGALLTFRAGDRSTLPRAVWILIYFNALAWAIGTTWYWKADAQVWAGLLGMMGLAGAFWFFLYGLVVIGEDYMLSHRQARSIREAPLFLRPFTWCLGPGAGRGRLGFAALWGLLAIQGAIAWWLYTVSHSSYQGWIGENIGYLAGFLCYGPIVLLVADTFYRNVMRRLFAEPMHRRVCTVVLLATLCVAPALLDAIFSELLEYEAFSELLRWLNPVAGSEAFGRLFRDPDLADIGERWPGVLPVAVFGLFAYLRLLIQGLTHLPLSSVEADATPPIRTIGGEK